MFFGRSHFFPTEINCLSLFIFTDVTFGRNVYNAATLSARIYFFFFAATTEIFATE